jgi:hypothetical protein
VLQLVQLDFSLAHNLHIVNPGTVVFIASTSLGSVS